MAARRYWPTATPCEEFGIGVLEQVFRALGYEDCGNDDSFEPGFQKVAIYGNALFYSHAAIQKNNGTRSSKLGKAEDIDHASPEDVAGGVYGEVVGILKRRAGGSA